MNLVSRTALSCSCKNYGSSSGVAKSERFGKLFELVSDNQFSCTGAFKLSQLIFLMFQRTEILLAKEIWPSANKSTNMDYIRKCKSHWMSHSMSLYIAVSCTFWNREDWLLRYSTVHWVEIILYARSLVHSDNACQVRSPNFWWCAPE